MRKIQKQAVAFMLMITLLLSHSVYGVAPSTLSDIKGNWAESYIQSLFSKGIITGNEKGMYEPKKSITRAEFTALLTRAMGLQKKEGSSFTDPGYSEYWARPYIEAAVAEGIIVPSEIGDSFFGSAPLKRSEMAAMMARALKLEPSDSQENPFADITEPNGYITKLYEEYLMRGYAESGKLLFKANNQTTKAEAATVVARILEYKADPVRFKDIAAMEERFKNGTQTEADIAYKHQYELEKQTADPNYFPEPVFEIIYNPGIGSYATIKIKNVDDYASDTLFKCESTSHKELNVFGANDMYFRYGETRQDNYRNIDIVKYNKLFGILKYNGKNVDGTAEYYYYNFPAGTKIMLKASIKRGITEKSYDITVIIQ